jgi:hypothetical protein
VLRDNRHNQHGRALQRLQDGPGGRLPHDRRGATQGEPAWVAPVLVVATVFVIGLAGAVVSRVGFAWLQPASFLAEEWTLLASLVMVAVDARRRPVLASVAYSMTLFVTLSVAFARLPAFAQSLPSVLETALAAAVTVLTGLAGVCSPTGQGSSSSVS